MHQFNEANKLNKLIRDVEPLRKKQSTIINKIIHVPFNIKSKWHITLEVMNPEGV